jgi:hypothetical protein
VSLENGSRAAARFGGEVNRFEMVATSSGMDVAEFCARAESQLAANRPSIYWVMASRLLRKELAGKMKLAFVRPRAQPSQCEG